MSAEDPSNENGSNGGIPTLFVVWLLSASAAILGFHFLPHGPREGFYRAIAILALAGVAMIDAIVAAWKTFRRRRGLSTATKSLGYTPFFFTTGSVGTLLQHIFTD